MRSTACISVAIGASGELGRWGADAVKVMVAKGVANYRKRYLGASQAVVSNSLALALAANDRMLGSVEIRLQKLKKCGVLGVCALSAQSHKRSTCMRS